MRIKKTLFVFALGLSLVLPILPCGVGVSAAETETETEERIIVASDGAVISQLNPSEKWTAGEELLLDVNHKDAALLKFQMPSELNEDSVVKLRIYSTAKYQSELKVYGIRLSGWSGESITWNTAGNAFLKDDYRLFSDKAVSISAFPLLGSEEIFGEVDVTDYVLSCADSSNITFGLSTLTSKTRLASHLHSKEEYRPCLIISKGEQEEEENIDEHIYSKALKFADGLEYLPAEGGRYYPERNVTAEEANHAFELMQHDTTSVFQKNTDVTYGAVVRELVKASGYDVLVRGSLTYSIVGAQAGITDGVSGADTEQVTRAVFAKLLYNTLNIDRMSQQTYGDQEIYGTYKGRTLLTQTRNIYTVKGIVDGNERTTLTSAGGIGRDGISIDGEAYFADKDTGELLGYRVTAWYYWEEGYDRGEILYIEPETGNNIAEFYYDDIIDYVGGVYTYETEEKARPQTARMDRDFDLIYNGISRNVFSNEDMKIQYGYVELVDNDDDGLYDVAHVTEYENYVVLMVNEAQEEIIDYYEPQKSLSFKDISVETEIKDLYGEELDFSDIRPWDAISVASSQDEKYITAIVVRQGLTGTVTEIADETVSIDGRMYEMSPLFLKYAAESIHVGDSVNIVLDAMDRIVAVKTASPTGMNYAYLIDGSLGSGLSDKLTLKLFTSQGSMEYYNCADSVTLDGERYSQQEAFGQLGGVAFQSQVVLYSTDSEGKITKLDTKKQGINESGSYLRELLPLTNGMIYRSRARALSSRLILDEKTVIFALPNDVKNADEKEFEVQSIAAFANDQTFNSVNAFGIDENSLIPTVITIAKENRGYTDLMLIESASTVIDEDGAVARKLYGILNGKEDSVVISGDLFEQARDYDAGDLIRYSKNGYGSVDALQRIYDKSSDAPFLLSNPTGSVRASNRLVYASVYNRKGNVIQITQDVYHSPLDTMEVYDTSQFTVYVYDETRKGDKAYIGNANVMTDYFNMNDSKQKVIVYTSYADPIAMIVYK